MEKSKQEDQAQRAVEGEAPSGFARGGGDVSPYKSKRIGVLMGGLSKEREISLRSGAAVAKALRNRGYEVVEIDAGPNLPFQLRDQKIEVAMILLHGRWGEDGTVQGLLEVMGIPYTGSGPLASGIAMDKDLTKKLVAEEGILTPQWKALHASRGRDLTSPFPYPVMVKPNSEGSTIGASIVRKDSEWGPALSEAFRHDSVVLVEEFIEGKELTVGLLNGRGLPVIEIVPKSGFYDYSSKYTKGMTEYLIPARISDAVRQEVTSISEKIFRLLRLAGMARTDFIWRERPYFLEVNTVPGMTETSLVPKACQSIGISMEELCEEILKEASLKI